MLKNDEEIVRIRVSIGNRRSTISMDYVLAEELEKRLGNEDAVKVWVNTAVNRLDQEWAEKSSGMSIGDRVRAKSGLSRMVQREALKFVLDQNSRSGVG